MSQADKWTAKELERLEKRISNEYKKAADYLTDRWDKYINGYDDKQIHYKSLKERWVHEYEAMEKGLYGYERFSTVRERKQAFRAWEQAQLGRGKHWEDLKNQMVARLSESATIAEGYINGVLPGVYVKNCNEIASIARASAMEQGVAGISFELVDEHTVKRLMMGSREVRPYKPIDINLKNLGSWNFTKLQNALLQGILAGDGIEEIADRFQRVSNMNRSMAIRNARTATTGAQNAGKQDRFTDLSEQGVIMTKIWVATEDARTRFEHEMADGQEVDVDDNFEVGGEYLNYPGDPVGSPWNIENCRCTMRTGETRFKSILSDRAREIDTIEVWEPSENRSITPIDLKRAISGRSTSVEQEYKTADLLFRHMCNFKSIDNNVYKLDSHLLAENAKQLTLLESRFKAIEKANVNLIAENDTGSFALVRKNLCTPHIQTLVLDSGWYSDANAIIEDMLDRKKHNEVMPCLDEELVIYPLTHEYGHIIANMLYVGEFEKRTWTKENPYRFLLDKPSQSDSEVWYSNVIINCASRYKREIIEIAQQFDPEASVIEYMSEYGNADAEEFFAEAFANSQLSKPNIIGRAMRKWLERKGL